MAVIRVEFKYGVNVDNKCQEVVREINALRSELPEDIFSIEIRKVDPSDVNILQVALVSENASYRQLKKEAEALKDQLEKVVDLKKAKISGVPDEEVGIDLRPEKLAGTTPLWMLFCAVRRMVP